MRIVSLLKRLFSVFLCFPFYLYSAETYRWVDLSGKVHYSDREPQNQKALPVNVKPIETLKFSQIKTKLARQKKHKKPRLKAISKCNKLKQQIVKLQHSLTQRQTAKDFDRENKKLVALRWQKIKNC